MSAWSRTTPPHTYACPQAPTSSLTTAERFLRSAAAYRWGGLAWGATAVRVQVQLPHREVGTVEVQGFEDSGCPASFTLRIILEPSVILSPSVSFWNPLYHFISLRIILDPPISFLLLALLLLIAALACLLLCVCRRCLACWRRPAWLAAVSPSPSSCSLHEGRPCRFWAGQGNEGTRVGRPGVGNEGGQARGMRERGWAGQGHEGMRVGRPGVGNEGGQARGMRERWWAGQGHQIRACTQHSLGAGSLCGEVIDRGPAPRLAA